MGGGRGGELLGASEEVLLISHLRDGWGGGELLGASEEVLLISHLRDGWGGGGGGGSY